MQYHSTRDSGCKLDSAAAVLQGLANDGGLFLPEKIPAFSWQDCVKADTVSMAEMILSVFLPDIPNMDQLVKKAYTGKFETEEPTWKNWTSSLASRPADQICGPRSWRV